ncbi:MAG: nuclear transport factor 2 family protein [Alphaproteobacteria bacterium]|nr:nuclear transport factor 2 family protein [Alphaproteobacteria bacterium]
MPDQATMDAFITTVESGKHDEAIARFYADDAATRDNAGAPRSGKENLLARERQFMAKFREIRTTCVRPVFVSDDYAVLRWIFEFVRPDGSSWAMEELAYQTWSGDRIVAEQFFFDPAQVKM